MHRDRGISTVFDVLLFLLIVSAAIGLLVTGYSEESEQPTMETASDVVTILSTSTETIVYTPDHSTVNTTDIDTRSDYGTVAHLLATAAVLEAEKSGEEIAATPAYTQAVTEATKGATAPVEDRVQVRAIWEPVPDGSVKGEVIVGDSPPPDKDVQAASISIPVAATDTPEQAEKSTQALSTVLAQATIESLFDTHRTKTAMESSHDEAEISIARYQDAATTLDADLSIALEQEDDSLARSILVGALEEEYRRDIVRNPDSVSDISDKAAPTEVTIVVRTWSA